LFRETVCYCSAIAAGRSALRDLVVSCHAESRADAFVSRGTRDDPTHWPLVKAIQATTAAPSFFGPVKFEGKSYVDGAVCANNPTALAIVEAAALWPGRPIEVIVSFGVGGNPGDEAAPAANPAPRLSERGLLLRPAALAHACIWLAARHARSSEDPPPQGLPTSRYPELIVCSWPQTRRTTSPPGWSTGWAS